MSKVFDEALRRTLYYEGGYSDNPHDPGGATKFGVSLRFLKSLGKLGDMDGDGDVDQADLMVVTQDPRRLRELYYENFWIAANCHRIYSEHLQIKLFDTAVNTGPGRAQRLMQKTFNMFGQELKVDGVIGPMTAAAINALHNRDWDILQAYRNVQLLFYRDLIAADRRLPEPKGLATFSRGWERRAAT